MNKPVNITLAKRFVSARLSTWACVIATLSVCLWVSNFLPIQRVDYQLTTNVAISQHRFPMLAKLKSQSSISKYDSAPFYVTEIKTYDEHLTAHSDLRSARLTLRHRTRGSIASTEKALEQLTAPERDTVECIQFKKQLEKEKWVAETLNHSLKRLQLDLEQSRNALVIDANDESPIDEIATDKTVLLQTRSPFRLSSFLSHSSGGNSIADLEKELQRKTHRQSETVESLTTALAMLKAKSRGFVSLTGAPSIVPLAHSVSLIRISFLFMICIAIFLLFRIWISPFVITQSSLRTTIRAVAARVCKTPSQKTPPFEFVEFIRELNAVGIPYLGTVQISSVRGQEERSKVLASPEFEAENSVAKDQSGCLVGSRVPNDRQTSSELLRSLGEGSLVLWIGLFLARLIFDPAWRELVAIAPLAAISRMVTGIQ